MSASEYLEQLKGDIAAANDLAREDALWAAERDYLLDEYADLTRP